VLLDVPAGLDLESVAPAEAGGAVVAGAGGLHYQLDASGYAAWDLVVRAPAAAGAGRYFVAARIIDEAGQVLEDAVAVSVGEMPPSAADVPLAELVPVLAAAGQAEAGEATLTMISGDLELIPGGRGTVTARLANHTRSELRGEVQLISPHGSWQALAGWTADVAVAPGESADLRFDVAISRDARPGQRWWALVKVMYFGRLRYSTPIWIGIVG
jgi:hypothetical protein